MFNDALTGPAIDRSAAQGGNASAWDERVAIAIPVKDEEERLPTCLCSLAEQVDQFGKRIPPESICVVAYVNNCSDNSAEVTRSLAERLKLNVRVIEAFLPPMDAHAGNARGGAMDFAEAWLVEKGRGDGVIMTTDADSQVPPTWLANNLAAIDRGADVVLGRVALDGDGDLLPEALRRRGLLEDAYESLLTELSAVLDPVDWNPWPHHGTISGASVAVRMDAYRSIGGLPRVPLGEDKALVAAFLAADARVRYAPEIEVVTSARLTGRAPGGVADTLRLRSAEPEACCDEALEPLRIAVRRARWRGELRRLRRSGALSDAGRWSVVLAISRADARRIVSATTFGKAWSLAESASPRLQRRLLTPAELPGQIEAARGALARFRTAALSARQNIEAEGTISVLPRDVERRAYKPDKETGGLITA